MIRSVVSPDRELYLTVEDGLHDSVSVVASPFPATWEVVANNEEQTIQ